MARKTESFNVWPFNTAAKTRPAATWPFPTPPVEEVKTGPKPTTTWPFPSIEEVLEKQRAAGITIRKPNAKPPLPDNVGTERRRRRMDRRRRDRRDE